MHITLKTGNHKMKIELKNKNLLMRGQNFRKITNGR